tara:strand:+ start:438 stop:983 length:546 start_codon:yes stop_codon:yes gene_type:complete
MKNEVKVGTILIAKPFMEDKRFEKTIILIAEVSTDGTVGFILNKQTSSTIDTIIPELPQSNTQVKYGGPVSTNNLFFIHQYPNLIKNSQQIQANMFWGGKLENVIQKYESGEIVMDNILFFLGYTGWEKNQLESEIKEGSWIIHDTTLNKINTHLDWYTLLIEINKEYEVWATAPADFHLN